MRKDFGFTLVELLVTLAIGAIVLAMATPSLAAFFRTNRVAGATNEVVLALQVARAEAARRGRDVSVCASSDGATCAGGTAWTGGWIVFQDANNTGTPASTGAGSELVRVFDGLDPSLTLTGPANYLRFRPDGSLDWSGASAGDRERQFDLRVESCSGTQRRTISVGRLGRVRSAVLGCSA